MMIVLVEVLARRVRAKVAEDVGGRSGGHLESRFVFNGPPLDLLEDVFEQLSADGGIRVTSLEGVDAVIPVLLQLPGSRLSGANPRVGESGRCDENHLLHLRNDPRNPSFVALVPPGQHSNRSVTSTTDEFGVSTSNNSSNAPFEDWLADDFIRSLIEEALKNAGLPADESARRLFEHGAQALDEVDDRRSERFQAWSLVARLFSIDPHSIGLPAFQALAMACGAPSDPSGNEAKTRLATLSALADALADGFSVGIERMRGRTTSQTVLMALDAFLSHLRARCDVPTAFERATAAFYVPNLGLKAEAPPDWWKTLTTQQWSELMADEPNISGDLSIECVNQLLSTSRGVVSVVRDEAEMRINARSKDGSPVDVLFERSAGAAATKISVPLTVAASKNFADSTLPRHRTPLAYKVTAPNFKPATAKVISLSSWVPGIVLCCRMATKLSPPKKPSSTRRGTASFETSLVLPGSGRYELAVLTSSGISLEKVTSSKDDATEVAEQVDSLSPRRIRDDEYQLEVEVDGKCQIDITYRRSDSAQLETCRAYLVCEEGIEEGCRSEFERLIKAHRAQSDAKTIIQLDRHARASSYQAWLLDPSVVARSFMPVVFADDYADFWSAPDWNGIEGPCLSVGRYLKDPRPAPSAFNAPVDFIAARTEIAARVRATVDGVGLVESSPLGQWIAEDMSFRQVVETYLDSYQAWLNADADIACWVDVAIVATVESNGKTLSRVPDAIILSPLHPLRFLWHCIAQQVLFDDLQGSGAVPCPAASILDPDCVPDLITLSLESPDGIDRVDFVSVENSSDYWSVMWNGSRLRDLPARCQQGPFDDAFGLRVGGVAQGFSSAQVARALEDVSDLLAAKSTISLVVSSSGGSTDACNEGLAAWCSNRYGRDGGSANHQSTGPKLLEVYDVRPQSSRPDDAMIANLAEDTDNAVRWFVGQPDSTKPDLGIVAQLSSAEPEVANVGMRSPVAPGGLIRHRVRRQLPDGFLSESRQSLPIAPSGDALTDKLSVAIGTVEGRREGKPGLRFAPDIHAVSGMLTERRADFVAISSTAIDPACFTGGWIDNAYLWDFDLPGYSNRAGDTSGYYLLSTIKPADREGLRRVLERLPKCEELGSKQIDEILLEVARRGIPTVRGLSGDDTGATGDLGLLIAVRLLQDEFRTQGSYPSLVPVLTGSERDAAIALVIPVDPFRGYLAALARAVGSEKKDAVANLSRPDLVVVGIHLSEAGVTLKLTPIEVKCRPNDRFGDSEALDALAQTKALCALLSALQERAMTSVLWRLAYQHLLLSMIGFGLRVYSQHQLAEKQTARWSTYHERIAEALLLTTPPIAVDQIGRVIIIDKSAASDAYDSDEDKFKETIRLTLADASGIVMGDPSAFYQSVQAKVADWDMLPLPQPPLEPSKPGPVSALPPVPRHTRGAGSEKQSDPPGVVDLLVVKPSTALEADTGVVLSVGATADGFQPRQLDLNLSDTRLNQLNIGVVGDLGTGKTQLLKSLIMQIASARRENQGVAPRILIFDYKRDYSSPDFVSATGARVVKPMRLPLNLFDTKSMSESSAPWLDRFRFFADVLDKVYTGIGPVQRDKLKGAVRAAYDAARARDAEPTIYDVHAEYKNLLAGKSDTPLAIIDDLVDMEVFAREGEILPFDRFFEGIVVISLDAMGQDDRSKNMLVAVMLNMFYENMLKLTKRPFVGTDPQLRVLDSYLLVDEADNIMRYEFDVLRKLLLQGREFGVGVILASQYLRHFKTGATDYREPLLTWFIHKVPNVTAAELSALGFTSDLVELTDRVKTLPNHHCLYKSFDVTGDVIRGLPFYELIAARQTSEDVKVPNV